MNALRTSRSAVPCVPLGLGRIVPCAAALRLAWLLLFSAAMLPAGAAELSPSAAGTNALPQVTSVSEPLQLGRPVKIHVAGLGPWVAAGNSAHTLLLYLDGRPAVGDYPQSVNLATGELVYYLRITAENRDLWEDILRRPTHLSRKLAVTIGPSVDSHFVAVRPGQNVVTLEIVPFPWGLVSLAVLGLTLAVLVHLARHTDLIRAAGPASTPGRLKPYSLARTQMAVWFYLVFSAYMAIWLLTGDLNTITESILGLLGISAGTALGGALIDNQKREATAGPLPKVAALPPDATPSGSLPPASTTTSAPSAADAAQPLREALDPGVSEGFLRDILSDGNGLSLHRFQILAWTIALGVIFIAATYNTLSMPDFSATLLGLMGISAGTYLGFKVPEK